MYVLAVGSSELPPRAWVIVGVGLRWTGFVWAVIGDQGVGRRAVLSLPRGGDQGLAHRGRDESIAP